MDRIFLGIDEVFLVVTMVFCHLNLKIPHLWLTVKENQGFSNLISYQYQDYSILVCLAFGFNLFRLRGFSGMFGINFAFQTILRLALESNPLSKLSSAPFMLSPTVLITLLNRFRLFGKRTQSFLFTAANSIGAKTLPASSVRPTTFCPFWCLCPE